MNERFFLNFREPFGSLIEIQAQWAQKATKTQNLVLSERGPRGPVLCALAGPPTPQCTAERTRSPDSRTITKTNSDPVK